MDRWTNIILALLLLTAIGVSLANLIKKGEFLKEDTSITTTLEIQNTADADE